MSDITRLFLCSISNDVRLGADLIYPTPPTLSALTFTTYCIIVLSFFSVWFNVEFFKDELSICRKKFNGREILSLFN